MYRRGGLASSAPHLITTRHAYSFQHLTGMPGGYHQAARIREAGAGVLHRQPSAPDCAAGATHRFEARGNKRKRISTWDQGKTCAPSMHCTETCAASAPPRIAPLAFTQQGAPQGDIPGLGRTTTHSDCQSIRADDSQAFLMRSMRRCAQRWGRRRSAQSVAAASRSMAMATLRRAIFMNISSPRSVWPTIIEAMTAMTSPA
jgi:hypothetical protein